MVSNDVCATNFVHKDFKHQFSEFSIIHWKISNLGTANFEALLLQKIIDKFWTKLKWSSKMYLHHLIRYIKDYIIFSSSLVCKLKMTLFSKMTKTLWQIPKEFSKEPMNVIKKLWHFKERLQIGFVKF